MTHILGSVARCKPKSHHAIARAQACRKENLTVLHRFNLMAGRLELTQHARHLPLTLLTRAAPFCPHCRHPQAACQTTRSAKG